MPPSPARPRLLCSSRPSKHRRVPDWFRSTRADIPTHTLTSNARVPVNAYRLGSQSQVFEDMLSIPSAGSNEVPVAETKAVLELVLLYCAQGRAPSFDLEGQHAWEAANGLDKYDVSTRGLKWTRNASGRLTCVWMCRSAAGWTPSAHRSSEHPTRHTLTPRWAIHADRIDPGYSRSCLKTRPTNSLVMGYLMARHFAPDRVDDVVRAIVDLDRAKLATFEDAFKTIVRQKEISDDGKLVSPLTSDVQMVRRLTDRSRCRRTCSSDAS